LDKLDKKLEQIFGKVNRLNRLGHGCLLPDRLLSKSYCKIDFSVILSAAQDIELIEKTRFFAALRMTKFLSREFCKSLEHLKEYRALGREFVTEWKIILPVFHPETTNIGDRSVLSNKAKPGSQSPKHSDFRDAGFPG